MSFNHSASNCMKLLLIISSESAKVTSRQCLSPILIIGFFQIKLFQVIHSVERRNFGNILNLFIQQMKYLLKDLFFLNNNMSWRAVYNFSNSNNNNLYKTFFILPKNGFYRKACFKPKRSEINVSTF